ncbi:MAG TPA: FkbM family methyltransferase [Solirubrobacteraceae bacterium]|nr:FkbM family methyltransferase [Solirubrobacteraceae bacterium]
MSRRLDRPELLAVFEPRARQAQREAIGINAALATALGGAATYVDVGSNRGQVLREAVRVAPRARHIAFEPIPALAQEIARAFPSVDCRRKALGKSAGSAEFCHFTQLDGWSGLRRNPEISDERGKPELITVEVSTLDAELAGLTPTVIKIDVEGAELAVLEGGRAVLANAHPLLIFEHVPETAALYGDAPDAVWELLAELDYEAFSATGDGPFTRASLPRSASVVNWLARPGVGVV